MEKALGSINGDGRRREKKKRKNGGNGEVDGEKGIRIRIRNVRKISRTLRT